jgi:serine-type D-Ala-D-Ala carboxypeptidase
MGSKGARRIGEALGERLPPLAAVALGLGLHAGWSASTAPKPVVAAEPPRAVVPRHPVVFDQGRLAAADSVVERAHERGAFPGAVLVVGVGPQVVHSRAWGRTTWEGASDPVDPLATMYDLASLTKAVATATAVWLLVEDGRMRLDDPVSRWLPHFGGGREHGVTVRQLLTHTAGVRAGAFPRSDDPATVRRQLVELTPLLPPGRDVLYSDLGYVVLWEAAERAAGEPLPAFLHRRVWEPLGMRSTRFGVPRGCGRCAPSLHLRTGEPYRGGSYDHVARRLGGIAGNAGLFSTADDLARFAGMIAGGGALGGVRILREETVRAMLAPHDGSGSFTLGWATYCREGIVPDHRSCRERLAVGHTGASGTSLWIEPGSGTWVLLLTNRTYLPRTRDVNMQQLRRRLFREVTGQLEGPGG